jgi:hypothetical protein
MWTRSTPTTTPGCPTELRIMTPGVARRGSRLALVVPWRGPRGADPSPEATYSPFHQNDHGGDSSTEGYPYQAGKPVAVSHRRPLLCGIRTLLLRRHQGRQGRIAVARFLDGVGNLLKGLLPAEADSVRTEPRGAAGTIGARPTPSPPLACARVFPRTRSVAGPVRG